MKKRLLFILIVFIAWLPVFVIQKPVFMFYQHALSEACTFTDFLQVMLHGLKLDCTIAVSYTHLDVYKRQSLS